MTKVAVPHSQWQHRQPVKAMALVVSHNSVNTWILLAVPLPQVQCSWIQIMQQSFLSSHVSAGAGQGGSKKRPTGKSKPPTRHSSSSSDSDYEELLHNTPHAKSGAGKGGSKRRPAHRQGSTEVQSLDGVQRQFHKFGCRRTFPQHTSCRIRKWMMQHATAYRRQRTYYFQRRGSGNKTLQVPQKINATAATAFATPRSWVLVSVPENVQLATTTAATVDYLVTITSC